MKQHKLSSVISVVIGITLIVVLDVSVIIYFIYCCVTVYHSIMEIIFWAIMMFISFGELNLLCIVMIKDILNK